ncbi:MAG: PaaI family thioesterase [Methanolinea sp.]|nr:PaaI family thioesterase [Methanolinea sp.]
MTVSGNGGPGRKVPGGDPGDLVARFNGSEYARLLGMEILSAGPGHATVRMDTRGKRNSRGFIHGGAIFSLADQAFGIAANLGSDSEVALSARIWYLRPARGDLTAKAECFGRTGAYSCYRVRVYDGDELVAVFEGEGMKMGRQAARNGTSVS